MVTPAVGVAASMAAVEADLFTAKVALMAAGPTAVDENMAVVNTAAARRARHEGWLDARAECPDAVGWLDLDAAAPRLIGRRIYVRRSTTGNGIRSAVAPRGAV